MPTPGLLYVNSRVTSPTLTPSAFDTWYTQEHIPDIFASKGITSAYRYKAIDPSALRPYLALYPVKDLDFLGSEEYMKISVRSEKYFGGRGAFEVAEFDTRYYEELEGFGKEGGSSELGSLLISVAYSSAPGADNEAAAPYNDEQHQILANCPGHIRTRRYKLKESVTGKFLDPQMVVPMYLALHEYDGKSLPQEELTNMLETEDGERNIEGWRLEEGFEDRVGKVAGDGDGMGKV
ncbi:uncharacterized protein BP5553_09673 [Venustampulla echinocandica]|uniref:EthD domain-containing protein n=1 Tax=Venustampulla echinocandica TaxID=2656787 RepID=A0A370TBN2_9HELO|nr:uncharacterized protein BP5553_09673 [Venustampulla echinocandica]RDL31464.1 hypothetical protein BP5553_09673 [Venustampulla echinocandica]